jgi:hypothetical protein
MLSMVMYYYMWYYDLLQLSSTCICHICIFRMWKMSVSLRWKSAFVSW